MRRYRTARGVGGFLVLVFLALPAVPRSPGQICDNWWRHDPAEAGDWFDPDNWTSGVPGLNDDACVDNGGTAVISSGTAQASRLCAGNLATGTIVQTGGSKTRVCLYLGRECGSSGTYELSGDGALLSSSADVGDAGSGTFRQSGGTHAISFSLILGWQPGGSGTYELSQPGLLTCDRNEIIGSSGSGDFRQTGGTHTVAADLVLARLEGSEGTYALSAGQLSAKTEYVGACGTGEFTQTGGTNTVTEDLYLGHESESGGTYELSGTGTLSAECEYIGCDGTGTFKQTGGANTVDYLPVGQAGRYEMTGGTLQAGGLRVDGELDFGSAAVSVSWEAALVDFCGTGTVRNGENASLVLGARSLTLVPPGFDPASVFGTYTTAGMTHVAGTTLVVPTGVTLRGSGQIDDHLVCEGSIAGEMLLLNAGVEVSGAGEVDMGRAGLTVEDNLSGISGGRISGSMGCVGYNGTATFTQTGGASTFTGDLHLGRNSGSHGTYELSGTGTLSAGSEIVGSCGVGSFKHTGGTNTVGEWLYVGHYRGSQGTYELSGTGILSAGWEYVGYDGTGTFTQTGGTNTVARGWPDWSGCVDIGFGADSRGTYELSGTGTLSAECECVGSSGTGTFRHTGGTNAVLHRLCLGRDRGAHGTYELSGTGTLSAEYEWVAYEGTGRFVQTGGTNTFDGDLCLAFMSSSNGTYELSGAGAVVATWSSEYVGFGGSGTFRQTGGTNTVGLPDLWFGRLCLGYHGTSQGTYELSGTGTLSVGGSEEVGRQGRGAFKQTGGTNTVEWRLSVGAGSGSNGTYELSGTGTLSVGGSEYVGHGGTGTFAQAGGTNTVADALYLGYESGASGTYVISGGVLSTGILTVGHEGSGAFHITGPAPEIGVAEKLRFGADSAFSAVPGAVIHMTGADFENANTDPAALAGLGNLTLIFEGGPAEMDDFEVAGEDVGAAAGGWTDNFALGTLQLGGASEGRIRLVDQCDNRPGWDGDEALYVHDLVLNAGAAISLNGLNLYYLNGGSAKQLFCGDATLDGRVDYVDLGILATYYDSSGATWARGDFDGDGIVNHVDLGVLATNYGSTGGEGTPVPEPATVLLAAFGALAVVRRRR